MKLLFSVEQKKKTSVGLLLEEAFDRFAEAALQYAVMRNAENLPEQTGRDLDIIVNPAHRNVMIHIITDLIDKHDFWLVAKRIGARRVHLNASGPDAIRLNFDIQWDLSHHRMVYGHAQKVLSRTVDDPRGFRRLAPPDEAATSVLNCILSGREVKTKYSQAIQKIAQKDPKALFTTLNEFVGQKLADRLFNSANNSDWSDTAAIKRQLVRGLRMRLQNGLFQELVARGSGNLKRWYQSANPQGSLIVFLGTHGAGKTTTASRFMERLKIVGYQVEYFHISSRPGVLFGFKRMLKGNDMPASANVSEIQQSTVEQDTELKGKRFSASQRIMETARLIYHALDFIAFYMKVVRPAGKRRTVILCDRYFYDYLVEQRGVGASPAGLRRVLATIIPRPRLLVHLKADPEIVYGRKRELSLEEIGNQIAAFETVVQKLGGVTVSVTKPPNDVCSEILHYLGPIETYPLP